MSKKLLWLSVSSLMALSLIMAACTPAATPTTPAAPTTPTTPTAPTTPPAPTAEKPQQEVVKPTEDKPQYGGTLYLALASDITTYAAIETC